MTGELEQRIEELEMSEAAAMESLEQVRQENRRITDNGRLYSLEECLARVCRLYRKDAKYRHECHEWDGMEIDEFSLEFNSCRCFDIAEDNVEYL